MIELLPWADEQVIAATEAARDHASDPDAKRRLAEFVEGVRAGQFDAYLDILRTPLFLKFTLDILRHEDLSAMKRSELVGHWARLKIARDVTAPARFGGERVAIRSGTTSVDETVSAAFAAMQSAAVAMCRRVEDRIELLPSCTFVEIRRIMAADAPDSATSLSLNSLLIPIETRQTDGTQRMRFAHRVFQEFFLARAVVDDPQLFPTAGLPRSVVEWIDELRPLTTSGS